MYIIYYTLNYIINILNMISKADKYRQMIQAATKRVILFPNVDNQEKKSTITLECDIKLPSFYPFRFSQLIENNKSTHQITHQSSQQYSISLQNEQPKSCIGLVLCEHHQNNQTFYVYGTGILIHRKIVLTSAQNTYCRRLNTQYTNVRFIVGVNGDKCSGIYDIKRVHYPKEYTMQEGYNNYNFAVLWLYDDLSDSCGYVGLKIMANIKEDEKQYTEYEYTTQNQEGYFNLIQRMKHEKQQQDQEHYSRSGMLIKKTENKYYILGLRKSERKVVLSDKISKTINQWTELTYINIVNKQTSLQACMYLSQVDFTHLTSINLNNNKIDTQGCKYLSQANWTYLTTIYLTRNNINAQGCKYLSQANWTYLTTIYLTRNNINAQGCKYLSEANWIHLITINFKENNIGAQGCMYLSQANWAHLATIYLVDNIVNEQGCKYLSQANWTHLTKIDLTRNSINAQGCKYLNQVNWTHLRWIGLVENNIGAQECKYLSQANWLHLTTINLNENNIGAQGCKYLSHGNWPHLTTIYLVENNIDAQGCKYLYQTNWTHLNTIILSHNSIGIQGCKYLSQTDWKHVTTIDLYNNKINNIIYRLLVQQSYPNVTGYPYN